MKPQQILLMFLPVLELFPKSSENERLTKVRFYVCFRVQLSAAHFVLLLDLAELS